MQQIENNTIIQGDCVESMRGMASNSAGLVYFDPPFFTQRTHTLSTRDNEKTYSFDDTFSSLESYLHVIESAVQESRRILTPQGSIFVHCDKTASHHIRFILEKIFGKEQFQSEIIWSYKRWSNAKKGLLNAHQVIFFFSKTSDFTFHTEYTEYSPTTNLDQILQKRERNSLGKSVYKRDAGGEIVFDDEKKGVPLSDVWEIPYLNPKAKERTGYPTQKPVALLQQIIRIASNEGDTVIDPFCGSGTTCVAAKLLRRNFIGIDSSPDAVRLSRERIEQMVVSESKRLQKGLAEFEQKNDEELALLRALNAIPVQRNTGIDGFLKEHFEGAPVPVKIQKSHETLEESMQKLENASIGKNFRKKIVLQTHLKSSLSLFQTPSNVVVIQSLEVQMKKHIKEQIFVDADVL
jgi:site-specific DNA-methyltransferase (adenine-specific)